MGTRLPRLRQAFDFDHISPGIEGRPRDFKNCVVVDDPKFKIQLTFYDNDPEKNPEEAPLYTRYILVGTKVGVVFSTFWHERQTMSENIAEKGKDEWYTWCLGLAGIRGVDYVRVKIMDA